MTRLLAVMVSLAVNYRKRYGVCCELPSMSSYAVNYQNCCVVCCESPRNGAVYCELQKMRGHHMLRITVSAASFAVNHQNLQLLDFSVTFAEALGHLEEAQQQKQERQR